MASSNCIFTDYYGLPIVFGLVALIGTVILASVGGKRVGFSGYIFGIWNLLAFSIHIIVDGYFLYTPRLMPKNSKESCYVSAVREMWLEYGEADSRLYIDDFQPMVLSMAYGIAIPGSILTFLTYLGHLTCAWWTHPTQIATAMLHLGLLYSYCMPEYLTGFAHVKDMKMFIVGNLLFIVMPLLALMNSFYKLSRKEAEKKKKDQ